MDRERIEWHQCYWYDTERTDLPRVLLIGDSIVCNYREAVVAGLKDRMTVTAFSTSKIVGDYAIYKELATALSDYRIDVIYFNNGLHGKNRDDDFYRRGLLDLVDFLRANSRAKLFWRSSTPITVAGKPEELSEKNAMVLRRNAIAAQVMSEAGIPVDDLYAAVVNHPEYSAGDGCHYNQLGCQAMGKHVCEFLTAALGD